MSTEEETLSVEQQSEAQESFNDQNAAESSEYASHEQEPSESVSQSYDQASSEFSEAASDGERQKESRPRDEGNDDEPESKKARVSSDAVASVEEAAASFAASSYPNPDGEGSVRASDANLFVNGLPSDYNETKLRALFSPYGEIETVKVMVDPMTNRTKGYGFVKFKEPKDAAKAIDGLNGTRLGERDLLVKIADQGRTGPVRIQSATPNGTPSPNVYVKGLPETLTDEQLRSLFAPFGTIIDTKILVDLQTQQSRGQAFVRYEQQQSAEYAIDALNGYTFPNTARGIVVRFADTKEEKLQRKQKLQQRAAGGAGAPGRYPGGAAPGYPPQYPGYPAAGGDMYAYAGYPGYAGYSAQYSQYYGAYPGYPGYGSYPGYAYPGYSTDGSTADPYQAAAAPTSSSSASSGSQQSSDGHLFIYHLPPDADDALLYRLFGPFGSVLSVKIMRDAVTGACKGFGFVKFGDAASATQAVQALNGYQIGNKRLQVSFKK